MQSFRFHISPCWLLLQGRYSHQGRFRGRAFADIWCDTFGSTSVSLPVSDVFARRRTLLAKGMLAYSLPLHLTSPESTSEFINIKKRGLVKYKISKTAGYKNEPRTDLQNPWRSPAEEHRPQASTPCFCWHQQEHNLSVAALSSSPSPLQPVLPLRQRQECSVVSPRCRAPAACVSGHYSRDRLYFGGVL